MTSGAVFAVAVVAKWLAVLGITFFACELMTAGKDGWGWLVFLAVLACCTNVKTEGA